ncbi:MAG: DUF2961 domain-containing protein [Phycisphaerales bacterium]|nr:DUF2961 domain-containing protein [Phycisphaerales bacterium]
MTSLRALVACIATTVGLASAAAQDAALDSLMRVRDAVSGRVSSANPEAWSNADNRWVKPGETFTLAEIEGPGVVRHIWFTFAESGPSWLSKEGAADPSEIVLRMYWDGAAEPAVESPLGDFFAAGFGKRAECVSAPIAVQGGDSYNCYWPMPFKTSARLTITNESDKPLAALYYQIDFTREKALGPDTAYFCAQYRQEFPTRTGDDYLIADIEGRGQYVGTVMSVRSRSPQWFGEGDDKFYVDEQRTESRPTMQGTGTEDYFSNAWGMEKACYPYFGVTILDGWLADLGNRGTMYRWHIADPVCFQKSLRVTIEHKGWMSADETSTGKVEGHVERDDDFATVAFWYQVGQPKRFATLPGAKERKFPSIDTVIGGKELLAKAKAKDAALWLQAGALWTGEGQLFIDAKGEGASVETTFSVPAGLVHRPVLAVTHSYDFGTWRVLIDGAPVGEPIDFYSKDVDVQEHVLSEEPLAPGEHTLRLECVGKDRASQGFKLGVDSVRLRHRTGAKRPPLGPARGGK